MTKISITDSYNRNCPIRNILSRLSDKWSILTIMVLDKNDEPLRFKELQRSIPDISQKMLTVTLRTLEEDGLVTRKAFPVVPPRVEYALTERAYTLIPHINNLIEWASANMDDIMHDRWKSMKKKQK
ncbi:MAG TPA: helix-turn-helix domain-containing protein [Bacteroidaceae bacterium]|nr:helix-turn-helix domain-containing protein [Bacteroidaceae bacterium]